MAKMGPIEFLKNTTKKKSARKVTGLTSKHLLPTIRLSTRNDTGHCNLQSIRICMCKKDSRLYMVLEQTGYASLLCQVVDNKKNVTNMTIISVFLASIGGNKINKNSYCCPVNFQNKVGWL